MRIYLHWNNHRFGKSSNLHALHGDNDDGDNGHHCPGNFGHYPLEDYDQILVTDNRIWDHISRQNSTSKFSVHFCTQIGQIGRIVFGMKMDHICSFCS